MKKIRIEDGTRWRAMSAMRNMEVYLHTQDADEKKQAYETLKFDIRFISKEFGLSYEEIYETISNLTFENYNLTWLRRLILEKYSRDTGKKWFGRQYIGKKPVDYV